MRLQVNHNMFFLVGHRASGKTESGNLLSSNFGFLSIDTGDVVRAYKSRMVPPEVSLAEWERGLISERGSLAVTDLISAHIYTAVLERSRQQNPFSEIAVLGNRQIEGVKGIIQYLSEVEGMMPYVTPTIIALEASDETLYKRHIHRKREIDEVNMTFEVFRADVLDTERNQGLNTLLAEAKYKIFNNEEGLQTLEDQVIALFRDNFGFHLVNNLEEGYSQKERRV